VPLSAVFYAFLARLAAGSLVALLPLWGLRAAERHVRFQLLFVACVALGAAALHAGADLGTAGGPRGFAAFLHAGATLPGALALTGVLCLAANALLGTFRRRAARAVLVAATAAAVVGVVGSVRLGPGGADVGPGALAVLALSALLGGIVMGAIENAMILGHFYLMIRGLPLDALRRAGRTVGAALLAKIAVFAGVLLLWHGAAAVLLEREVLWTTWRVTFGFVGPLVLLWMVKDTVRLQHTQAATGLLYVAVGFALMGELAAVYLELAAGVPA
jgi:hypothetical protein